MLRDTAGWVQLAPPTNWNRAALAALDDLVHALENGGSEPLLGATNARIATEIILASYESSYRRSRVSLPLDVSDFTLERLAAAEQALPEEIF